jgi:hypothetical protein
LSLIVESDGHVEVLSISSSSSSINGGGGEGLTGDATVAITMDKAAADEVGEEGEKEESTTPYSADISLDTPKSYMSATGSIVRV